MPEFYQRGQSWAVVAERFGPRVAVADRDGTITYAALFRCAAALAERLIGAGVRPGDPVVCFVRNSDGPSTRSGTTEPLDDAVTSTS